MTRRLPHPLPDALRAIGEDVSGRAWLDRLPGLLDEVAEQWQLRLGEAFPDASASLTLRAFRTKKTFSWVCPVSFTVAAECRRVPTRRFAVARASASPVR